MFLIGLGVFGSLILATELGYRIGRRRRTAAADEGPVGAVQGGVLGILGLLLGFSFAGAASRFVDRQDIVVQEANAIGTAVLRTDLLEDPHRTACRQALRRYLDLRIALFREFDDERFNRLLAECEELHKAMWAAALGGGGRTSQTVVLSVLPPLNDVIDLHTTRLAAARRHMPTAVTVLLAVAAILAHGVIGYQAGVGGKRNLGMTGSLILLVGLALWATIDMDYPRVGFIQLNQTPLLDLQRSLQ
jgi:hypothetical protein